MNSSSVDFNLPELIAHLNPQNTERNVAKLNRLIKDLHYLHSLHPHLQGGKTHVLSVASITQLMSLLLFFKKMLKLNINLTST